MPDRPRLPYIDLKNWAGLYTKSSTDVLSPEQLKVATNVDFFDKYGAISKLKGSERILSSQYQEAAVSKPLSWIGFYKAADLSGVILRHVLIAAGTYVKRLDGSSLIDIPNTSTGQSSTSGRTSGLFHTYDQLDRFLYFTNYDPDVFGRGNQMLKYDGARLSNWGLVPPGSQEEVEEDFSSAASFTATNCTASDDTDVSFDGAAVKITQTSGTSCSIEKTITAFDPISDGRTSGFIGGLSEERISFWLHIPRGQLDNANTDTIDSDSNVARALSVYFGSDSSNYWRFDFQKGELFEGWNLIKIDISTAIDAGGPDTGTTVGSFDPSPTGSDDDIAYIKFELVNNGTNFENIRFDRLVRFDQGAPTAVAKGSGTFSGNYRWRTTFVNKYGHEALDITTPIFTPKGWKTVKDICVGDHVFTPEGIPTKVIKTTEIFENRGCYKIKFRTGEEIVADAGHMWSGYIRDHMINNQKEKILTTEELFNSDYSKFNIPVTAPLQLSPQEQIIPAYVLGAWLGDGTSNSSQFTCADEEIIEEIKKCGYEVIRQPSTDYGWCIRGLITQLKLINVYKNKHIPLSYKMSGIEDRLAVLQGLMDTDGHCSTTGKAVFSNKNKTLIDDVYWVIKSLGLKATISRRAKDDCYTIVFRSPKSLPLFKLSRKFNRQPKKVREWRNYYQIENIERINSVPVKCISVQSNTKTFLAGIGLIPTHNSNTGPRSDQLTASNNANFYLNFIPVSEDKQVVARRLYRTVAGGTIFLRLDEIPNNVATSYEDTVPDGSLSEITAPQAGDFSDDNSPPPKGGIFKIWKRTGFLAGDPQNPTTLYFSEDDDMESWPIINAFELDDKITGIYETYSGLVVETETGKWQVLGDNPDFAVDKLVENMGCVGRRACGTARLLGFATDRDGLRLFDLSDTSKISEPIRDKYEGINRENIEFIHTVHSRARNGIIQFNPASGAVSPAVPPTYNNIFHFQYAVDDVRTGWWSDISPPSGINIIASEEVEDSNGDFRVYAGTSDGMLLEIITTDSKNWVNSTGTETAVTSEFQTPYLRLGPLGAELEGVTGKVEPTYLEIRHNGDATTWTATIDMAEGPDQAQPTDTTTITFNFGSNNSLLRLPIKFGTAVRSEYVRIKLSNNALNVNSTITAVRLYFHVREGQFPVTESKSTV